MEKLGVVDKKMTTLLDKGAARFILSDDAARYHRLSATFVCTDGFLHECLSALLYPTATSIAGFHQRLKDSLMGGADMLPAATGDIIFSIIEGVLGSPVVKNAVHACRQSADNRIIAIDAQWSTLMNALYQVPHGVEKYGDESVQDTTKVHCIHTVSARDTLLLRRAQGSEGLGAQVSSLISAMGGR